MPTSPIAILGAGVSGLTTALILARRGLAPVIYAPPTPTRASPPPSSPVAPAMFTPYASADTPAFRRRTETSYRAFADLAAGGIGFPADAVGNEARSPALGRSHASAGKPMPPRPIIHVAELREYQYTPAPQPAWLTSLLSARTIPAPNPFAAATTSLRPHIDMDRYLPWLRSEVVASGGRFESVEAPSFDAVFARGHSTIINCAGLGARALTRDPLLRPMHGQVLHVPNDIGLDYSLHDDGPGGRIAYIFNFGDRLVLGGTFDPGREDRLHDEGTLAAIVDRCRNLLRLDGHPGWEGLARSRLSARAAPRPCRGAGAPTEDIRLEREDLPGGRVIIHNYGHGRTGVTLSWGCAAEAAELATRLMD